MYMLTPLADSLDSLNLPNFLAIPKLRRLIPHQVDTGLNTGRWFLPRHPVYMRLGSRLFTYTMWGKGMLPPSPFLFLCNTHKIYIYNTCIYEYMGFIKKVPKRWSPPLHRCNMLSQIKGVFHVFPISPFPSLPLPLIFAPQISPKLLTFFFTEILFLRGIFGCNPGAHTFIQHQTN